MKVKRDFDVKPELQVKAEVKLDIPEGFKPGSKHSPQSQVVQFRLVDFVIVIYYVFIYCDNLIVIVKLIVIVNPIFIVLQVDYSKPIGQAPRFSKEVCVYKF